MMYGELPHISLPLSAHRPPYYQYPLHETLFTLRNQHQPIITQASQLTFESTPSAIHPVGLDLCGGMAPPLVFCVGNFPVLKILCALPHFCNAFQLLIFLHTLDSFVL